MGSALSVCLASTARMPFAVATMPLISVSVLLVSVQTAVPGVGGPTLLADAPPPALGEGDGEGSAYAAVGTSASTTAAAAAESSLRRWGRPGGRRRMGTSLSERRALC